MTLRDEDAWQDSYQDSYFDADSRPTSPELGLWLAASPSAGALPTASAILSDRAQPVLHGLARGDADAAAAPHPKPSARIETVSHATGKPHRP